MTFSCQNNERNQLQETEVTQPIAWCRMKDEHWSQLDNAVYNKIQTENTIERLRTPERLYFLQKTIYDEAIKLFGHKRKSPVRNLTFQS